MQSHRLINIAYLLSWLGYMTAHSTLDIIELVKTEQEAYREAREDLRKVRIHGNKSQKVYAHATGQFKDIEDTKCEYEIHPTKHHGGENSSLLTLSNSSQIREKRKVAREYKAPRWPNKEIPWRVSRREFRGINYILVRRAVRNALKEWETRSCVRFPEVSNAPHLVEIVNGKGCLSYVGFLGGVQPMTLAMNDGKGSCMHHGIIMHEFGHAAGFLHEKSRPDRDNEIRVYYNNIDSSHLVNFEKASLKSVYDYSNTPYDVSSLMHYGLQDFSSGMSKTLLLEQPELEVLAGQRVGASYYDEVAMNKAYDCADGCKEMCKNHGYVRRIGSSCKCFCPPYLGGPNCTEVSTSCGGVYHLKPDQAVPVQSLNYPANYNLEDCVYLFSAPSDHYIQLAFEEFNLPTSCHHYFDIHSNALGQESYQFLCGSGKVEEITTFSSIQKDKLLVVFRGSDRRQRPSGRYMFNVIAVADACLNNPCHGTPCVSSGTRQHSCEFASYPVSCNFEHGLLADCSAINVNGYYDKAASSGRAWNIINNSTAKKNKLLSAVEGNYYLGTQTEKGLETFQRGTITIIPTRVGGDVWCLDFKYVVSGPLSEQLSVYKVVNGVRGPAIFVAMGRQLSKDWHRILINIDGQENSAEDMIEVMFEANYTGFSNESYIGLDDIKYRPGSCPAELSPCYSYPCGNHICSETDLGGFECIRPADDITCSFEFGETSCGVLMDIFVEGDDFDPQINTGSTPSPNTGPSKAHSGISYIYIEASGKRQNMAAHIKILPLSHENKTLSFWYHSYGRGAGKINVYIMKNHQRPSLKNRIEQVCEGDQHDLWRYYETDIDMSSYEKSDVVEVIIELVRGPSYSGDIAIDDIALKKAQRLKI